MKRGILLTALVAIVFTGIFSVKEWLPAMAIAGGSAAIALALSAFSFYADRLTRLMPRRALAPIIKQNQELASRQEQSLQTCNQALEHFASAMAEYAYHLANHTSAIKNLAGASQELRDAVHEQNRTLRQWQRLMIPDEANPESAAERATSSNQATSASPLAPEHTEGSYAALHPCQVRR